MSDKTTNLSLNKPNATTDSNVAFNLDTFLNANWDKIDTIIGSLSSLSTTDKTNLVAALNELVTNKAPLASPALTGNPTAPTQATTDNSTKIATTAFINNLLGAMASNIVFANDATFAFRGVQGQIGGSDYWRVGGGATASDSGYLEIATADNGNEPIYVRQYTSVFGTILRTLTLLDASGDTTIPGHLTLTAQNAGIDMGSSSASNTPYIDFHSSANSVDYDGRITCSGGSSTNGQGTINVVSNGLQVNGNNVVRALNGGYKRQMGQTNVVVATAGTAVSVTITLPTAYTSSCDSVSVSVINVSVGNSGYINVSANTATTTSFKITVNSYVAQTIAVQWIADGQ